MKKHIIALGLGLVCAIAPSVASSQQFSLGFRSQPRYYELDRADWDAPRPHYRGYGSTRGYSFDGERRARRGPPGIVAAQ